jgi:hypothetical protein
MRCSPVLIAAAFCLCASGQTPPTEKTLGLPPRLAATDYQAHAQAGAITIAAEFTGHAVPLPEETLSTEDYVVVETAIFGPANTRIQLSLEDFSLRVNGKKNALPNQPFGVVFQSLKNPDLEPPASAAKSKTSVGSGGQGGDSSPPPVFHLPPEVKHAMQQHVQKAALPLGDRVMPVAGLIFFQYRGKNIQSLELIYSGPAGKATLDLRP